MPGSKTWLSGVVSNRHSNCAATTTTLYARVKLCFAVNYD